LVKKSQTNHVETYAYLAKVTVVSISERILLNHSFSRVHVLKQSSAFGHLYTFVYFSWCLNNQNI